MQRRVSIAHSSRLTCEKDREREKESESGRFFFIRDTHTRTRHVVRGRERTPEFNSKVRERTRSQTFSEQSGVSPLARDTCKCPLLKIALCVLLIGEESTDSEEEHYATRN